jgi:hypothetical protein
MKHAPRHHTTKRDAGYIVPKRSRFIAEARPFVRALQDLGFVTNIQSEHVKTRISGQPPSEPVVIDGFSLEHDCARIIFYAGPVNQAMDVYCPKENMPDLVRFIDDYCEAFARDFAVERASEKQDN